MWTDDGDCFILIFLENNNLPVCAACFVPFVGNDLRCQGHIVYKLFGHMVYNFDKLSTEDFSRNKELFIQIDFGNYELTIAKGNDITL